MGARHKKGISESLASPKEPAIAETTVSGRAVTAAVSGIAAAWLAAGSVGAMAHPLRHALTWVALGIVMLACWPPVERGWKQKALLGSAAVLAALMTMSSLAVYNVFAVTLVLAAVTAMRAGLERRLMLIVTLAAGLLGLYHLALSSIPLVWLAADALSYGLGRFAGNLVEQPLWIGPSFAGLGFLIVMGAVYAGWLIATPSPRLPRALAGLTAIVVSQVLYLILLCYAAELQAALPAPPPPPESEQYIPPDWSWSAEVAHLLPWNLPIVGAAIQLIVALGMFCWVSWVPVGSGEGKPLSGAQDDRSVPAIVLYGLALLIPFLSAFSLGSGELRGKRIVVYNKGYLNWLKPVFDQYGQPSAGAYGMLPEFVKSLGGQMLRSDELSDAELAKADVLVLIHPLSPWPETLQKRVWDYVRRGGSLLVVAEPRVWDEKQTSAFDELLAPTSIRVRHDTAIATSYKWEHSCTTLSHPATTGLNAEPNQLGLMRGSSLAVGWPARPIVVGKWGWSDPGSDALITLTFRYETGERLGDLVLAAEQRVGQGTVVVLADSYGLKNEGLSGAYPFTGRLLGYLAGHCSSPQAAGRQILGLAACLLLVGLVIRRPRPAQVAVIVVLMGAGLALVTEIGHSQSAVLPDGTQGKPYNNIAYIDAAHVGAACSVDWTFDDIMGLKLNLMRNGYLPLLLPEFNADALRRAGLFITIAPARAFSPDERQVVREFVEKGGTFICMAGAEHAGPVAPLLADFGFRVPMSPLPVGDPSEPRPMGCVRAAYLSSPESRADVIIYAGWPIEYPPQSTRLMVAGREEKAVMALAHVGQGKVLVVGDTAFAMNKNLEYVTGDPFDGKYENAHFWRWLATYINDQPQWIPPEMYEATTDSAKAAAGKPEPLRKN